MFRFGEVEHALQTMHDVAPDKVKAFRSRLRNFRRAGLDLGAGAGPGPKPSISIGDAVRTALAVELGQFGNTPERCVEIVDSNIGQIRAAVLGSAQSKEHVLLYFYPLAWNELSNSAADGGDMSVSTFDWLPASKFADEVAGFARVGRLAIINLSDMIDHLVAGLCPAEKRAATLSDLRRWAEE
jgi:hypothetical protein